MPWMAMSGTAYGVKGSDPASGTYAFNSPTDFVGGSSLSASPVPGGYSAVPFLFYTSYAQFSSDITNGAITYPYQWVMYDNEEGGGTPANEGQDPITYMGNFGDLAHAHGYKVIFGPGLDLANVSGTLYPPQQGESDSAWFTRVNLAAVAAAHGDILLLQNESLMTTPTQYAAFYNTTVSQVQAVNPAVPVWPEVSTANGTPDQMVAAYNSVSAPGWFLSAPSDTPDAVTFLQKIRNTYVRNNQSASGSVASPAAGATVVTLTPAAGWYDVDVYGCFTGTLASAEACNMQFNGPQITSTIIITTSGGTPPVKQSYRMYLDGATAISVTAIGAGTSTAHYWASIVCNPISQLQAGGQL